jgi:hypothetical protein
VKLQRLGVLSLSIFRVSHADDKGLSGHTGKALECVRGRLRIPPIGPGAVALRELQQRKRRKPFAAGLFKHTPLKVSRDVLTT